MIQDFLPSSLQNILNTYISSSLRYIFLTLTFLDLDYNILNFDGRSILIQKTNCSRYFHQSSNKVI